MEKISTSELIKKVATDTKMTQADVKKMLKSTVDYILDYASSGQAVTVRGLGTFKPVERAARTARNPRTGAEIQVDAKRLLGFKAEAGNKDI